MKLSLISESAILTLYKGISEWSGLNDWPVKEPGKTGKVIPGFLSNLYLARVYAEPELTGSADSSSMIAKFQIDPKMIEDRTETFIDWCDQKSLEHDVSIEFPLEWRLDKSIWTVRNSGSAHGNAKVDLPGDISFVYAGVPLSYLVVEFYNDQDEWLQSRSK